MTVAESTGMSPDSIEAGRMRDRCDLTFIIPSFNAAATIVQCLDSILGQYLPVSYECIIVDDASEDDTPFIAKRYAERYDFVRFFAQERAGAGAARNLGLRHARGEFLWFVDADDRLADNAYEAVLADALKHRADVFIFDFKVIYGKNGKPVPSPAGERAVYEHRDIRDKAVTLADCPDLLIPSSFPWNKIFSRRFAVENELRFSETMVLNDVYFCVQALCLARAIRTSLKVGYVYSVDDSSITRNISDGRRLSALSAFADCDKFIDRIVVNRECIRAGYRARKAINLAFNMARAEEAIKAAFIEALGMYSGEEMLDVLSNNRVGETHKRNMLEATESILARESGGTPALSFIVAVRDDSPLVPICLERLFNQFANKDLFEILVVVREGTGGLERAERFADGKGNVRILAAERDGEDTAGELWFAGLSEARGRHVCLLEPGALFHHDAMRTVLPALMGKSADLILYGFDTVVGKGKRISPNPGYWPFKPRTLNYVHLKTQKARQTAFGGTHPLLAARIYRREFLVEILASDRVGILDNPHVMHYCGLNSADSILVVRGTHLDQVFDDAVSLKSGESHSLECLNRFLDWYSMRIRDRQIGILDELSVTRHALRRIEAARDILGDTPVVRAALRNCLPLRLRDLRKYRELLPNPSRSMAARAYFMSRARVVAGACAGRGVAFLGRLYRAVAPVLKFGGK